MNGLRVDRGAAQPGPSRSAIVADCAGAMAIAVLIVVTPNPGVRVRVDPNVPSFHIADDRQPSYMQEHHVPPVSGSPAGNLNRGFY